MAMYRVEVVTDDMEDVFDHVAKIATEVFCAVDVDVGVLVTKEVDDKFFDVNSVETGYVQMQFGAFGVAVEAFKFVLRGTTDFEDVIVFEDGFSGLQEIDRVVHDKMNNKRGECLNGGVRQQVEWQNRQSAREINKLDMFAITIFT